VASLAIAAGGCLRSTAPESPYPEDRTHWVRERWQAVSTALEVPDAPAGGFAEATLRISPFGRFRLGAGTSLVVTVPADSALRVDARSLVAARGPGALSRVRLERLEGPGAGGAPAPQSGIAAIDVQPLAGASGDLVVRTAAGGPSTFAIRLGPDPENGDDGLETEVVCAHRVLLPVQHRFEGLEERAKLRDLRPGPAVDLAPALYRPARGLAEAVLVALPFPPAEAASEPALARAEAAFLRAVYLLASLPERVSDPREHWHEYPPGTAGSAPRVGVARDLGGDYLEAGPGSPVDLEAAGPCLLRLETRVPYVEGPTEEARRYRLSVEIDGGLEASLAFLTTVDDLDGLRRDGAGRPVGRIETAHVRIPPGRHAVRLTTVEPVLIRATRRVKKEHVLDAIDRSEDPDRWLSEARLAAAEAVASRPDDWRPRFIAAAALVWLGRAPAARAHLRAVEAMPEIAPDSRLALDLHLGRLAAAAREDPEALVRLGRAAGPVGPPGTASPVLPPTILRKHARVELARLAEARSRAAEAAAAYDRLAAEWPADADLQAATARAWLDVPAAEVAEPIALAAAERAVALAPDDPRYRRLRDAIRLRATYWQELAPARKPRGYALEVFVAADAVGPVAVVAGEPDPDLLLAVEPDERLDVAVATPAVARIILRRPEGAAPAPVEVRLDGRRVAAATLVGAEARLRIGVPAGTEGLSVEAPPDTRIFVAGLSPADPARPRLRRLRLHRLPEGREGALVHALEPGAEPVEIRVLAFSPGAPEGLPEGARVHLAVAPGRAVAARLEIPDEPIPAPPGADPGLVFRLFERVPPGPVAVLVWGEGLGGAPLSVALAARRRTRESPSAPAAPLAPAPAARRPAPATAPDMAPPTPGEEERLRIVSAATRLLLRVPPAGEPERDRARVFRARALLGLERPRHAAADLLSLLGSPALAAGTRAEALALLVEAYRASGEVDMALAVAGHLAADRPLDGEARLRLGEVCLDAGELRTAELHFTALLRDDPGSREARAGLGETLARRGDHAGAETALRPLAGDATAPPDATGLRGALWLAIALHGTGRTAEAAAVVRRAQAAAGRASAPGAGTTARPDGRAAPQAKDEEPGEEELAPAAVRTTLEAQLLADLAAFLESVAPLLDAAQDAQRPPLDRARALVALGRLDAFRHVRAGRALFEAPPPQALDYERRDRLISLETARTGHSYDTAGAGMAVRIVGPATVRLEARPDHPSAEPPGSSGADAPPRARVRASLEIDGPAGRRTSEIELEALAPSPSLVYPERPSLRPGALQLVDIAVGPGPHEVRVRSGGGLHVRPLVLAPGPEEVPAYPLPGGDPGAAAYAEALRWLASVPSPAPAEARRLELEARAALGLLDPEGRIAAAALASGPAPPEETPLADIDRARLLIYLDEARAAAPYLRGLIVARGGDPEVAALALAALEAPGVAEEDLGLSRLLAGGATALAQSPRLRAKLARTAVGLGQRTRDARARWFTRAFLLLRDLRAAGADDAEVAALYEEALARTDWAEVTGAAGAAGFERVLSPVRLLSLRARVLGAMLAPPTEDAVGAGGLITPRRATEFGLTLASPVELALDLSANDFLAAYRRRGVSGLGAGREVGPAPPLRFAIALDGAPLTTTSVEPGFNLTLSLGQVGAGSHRLAVALVDGTPGQAGRAVLLAARPLGAATPGPRIERLGRPFHAIVQAASVEYRVATAAEPLRMRLRGPTLLRADVRLALPAGDGPAGSGPVLVRVEVEDEPAQTFEIPAERSSTDEFRDRRALVPSVERQLRIPLPQDREYLVSIAPRDPGGPRLLIKPYARIDRSPEAVPVEGGGDGPGPATPPATTEPPARDGASPGGRAPWPGDRRLAEAFPTADGDRTGPGPAEPREALGTFEAYAAGGVFDEGDDDVEDRSLVDYAEIGLVHRKLFEGPETPVWLRSRLAIRFPESQGEVYRLEEVAFWATPFLGLRLVGRAEGNLQVVEGDAEGSLEGEIRLERLFPLLFNDLDLFAVVLYRQKEQTLEAFGDIDEGDIYFDVFSPFYEDHDRALAARLTLTYRPFLDLQFFVSGSTTTNRELSPGDLDRFYVRGGLRGFAGPVAFELRHDTLHRFDDDDRRDSSSENAVVAELDALVPLGGGLALRPTLLAYFVHDTDEAGLVFSFGIVRVGDRVVRDFYPGELLFDEPRDYHFREPAG